MPDFIKTQLWGDRKKWGIKPNILDEDWSSWQSTYDAFYSNNQRDGVGLKINDAGYQILAEEDFTGKVVLEIGPGDIRHTKFWKSKPSKYLLADIDNTMLIKGEKILKNNDISVESVLLERGQLLPFQDNSIDYIVTFYSLEHIDPIEDYLVELKRVLKVGGKIMGAIPAEGGFAWGMGRYLTSMQWMKKNTNIDYKKIICWEHPNFADTVIKSLNANFTKKKLNFWPINLFKHIDLNLIIRFVYEKK